MVRLELTVGFLLMLICRYSEIWVDWLLRGVCNTSRLSGLGKRKIIADRPLWVVGWRPENSKLRIASGCFWVISSGTFNVYQGIFISPDYTTSQLLFHPSSKLYQSYHVWYCARSLEFLRWLLLSTIASPADQFPWLLHQITLFLAGKLFHEILTRWCKVHSRLPENQSKK